MCLLRLTLIWIAVFHLCNFARAELNVHIGNVKLTVPNSYRVLTKGDNASIVSNEHSASVQIVSLDQVPTPSRKSVREIVGGIENASEVVVTHVKSSKRKNAILLTGEGTVRVDNRPSHFWFLTIPVGDRAPQLVLL